jgi:hypothetical protein
MEFEYSIRSKATGILLIDPTNWEDTDSIFRGMENLGYQDKIEIVKRPIGEWTVCSS